jgi:hypothetical protein
MIARRRFGGLTQLEELRVSVDAITSIAPELLRLTRDDFRAGSSSS